jgi:ABC-type nitrate/sulfonate/bicarbonate transport system substrate-binding protein
MYGGVAAVGTLAGCGSSKKTPAAAGSTTSTSAKGTRKLKLQASWVNDAEFLGYFVALSKGYYAAEGLDVTYVPGGPDTVPETVLLSGQADIALTTPDTTVTAILKQKAPLKIIAAQFQKNPLGVVSLRKNNITKPSDLIGKKLAVPDVNQTSVKAMLTINHVDPTKLSIVPYQYDPTPLLKGDVDATIDFVTEFRTPSSRRVPIPPPSSSPTSASASITTPSSSPTTPWPSGAS